MYNKERTFIYGQICLPFSKDIILLFLLHVRPFIVWLIEDELIRTGATRKGISSLRVLVWFCYGQPIAAIRTDYWWLDTATKLTGPTLRRITSVVLTHMLGALWTIINCLSTGAGRTTTSRYALKLNSTRLYWKCQGSQNWVMINHYMYSMRLRHWDVVVAKSKKSMNAYVNTNPDW